jgi:hypothetical protein
MPNFLRWLAQIAFNMITFQVLRLGARHFSYKRGGVEVVLHSTENVIYFYYTGGSNPCS